MTERTKPVPPSKEETGSAEGTPTKTYASVPDATGTTKAPASLHRITPLPLRWAKSLIDAAGDPPPEYGSPEWRELPDNSPVKVASCVLSAERWRTRHYAPAEGWTVSPRRTREMAAAQAPRPGDHLGGAVEQW